MSKILHNFSRFEKIVVVFLTAVIVFTSTHATYLFYHDNTEVLPAEGGIYAEGLVGQINLINPVFANQNPIDADITKLVFAGLMKYDAQENTIVDDLATHTLSSDKKTYTFTIRDNVYFHDGEKLTADDVLFTFRDVIQNEAFKNEMLRRDFTGITIEKIDTQTVTFTLPKPYKFFLTNLTIGILPKHLLFDLPIEKIDQSTFNQHPIGAGPYKFNQIIINKNSVDVNLKRFEEYYGLKPKLTGIVLKVYSNYNTLIKDLDILNGVLNIPKDQVDKFPLQNRFELASYHLPQYVALFLNTNSPLLKDQKVRLALQLATDRQEIIDNLGENLIIDDPLMEKDEQNWIYQYDPQKAAGALFDLGWKLPAKQGEEDVKSQTGEKLTQKPTNSFSFFQKAFAADLKYIYSPNQGNDLETTEKNLFILGNAPVGSQKIMVNGYTLSKFGSGSTTWSYKASTEIGTLKLGENLYEIYAIDENNNKNKIDEIKITLINQEEITPVVEKVESVVVEEKQVIEKTETSPEKIEEKTVEPVKTEEPKKEEVKEDPIIEEKEEITLLEKIEKIKPVRKNAENNDLKLRLITAQTPAFYADIAQEIQSKWLEVGVDLEIEVLDAENFQTRVRARDYDILLYGQSLGYNLDAYPYWHSSQRGENGLNLSNYASFEADSLMEEIRQTHDENRRQDSLEKLGKTMRNDVFAIFLYRPVYSFAYDKRLKNIELKDLPTRSERFSNIENWYLNEDRFFSEGTTWGNFWGWLVDESFKF